MALPPPRRRFGQNFLVDAPAIGWIVGKCGDGPVLEIGPGRGALTAPLSLRNAPLVALELDRDLASHLRTRFPASGHFRLVEGDALRIDWRSSIPEWFGAGVRPVVAGNLPYNVATPIVRSLLSAVDLFPRLVLMFQAEVADRLTATEGEDYGYLSVESQLSVRAVDRHDLPPGAFHPAPKVRSSVLVLEPLPDPPRVERRAGALRIASTVFAHRRKIALSNLRAILGPDQLDLAAVVLERAGLRGTARAEEIAPSLFLEIAEALEPSEAAPAAGARP